MFHHSWSVTGFGARNLDETVVMSFFSSYGPVSVSEPVADRAPPTLQACPAGQHAGISATNTCDASCCAASDEAFGT
jgi:hypothetical protein